MKDKFDRNESTPAGTALARAPRTGRCARRLAGEKAQQFPFQDRIGDRSDPLARVEHNVPSPRQLLPMLPENRPEAPLDAVAYHCTTHVFRHGDAQARPGQPVRSIKDGA